MAETGGVIIGGYDTSLVGDINRIRWYSVLSSETWIIHVKQLYIKNTPVLFKSDKTFLKAAISMYDDAVYVKTDIIANIYNVLKGY
jgi:hypothetical protein